MRATLALVLVGLLMLACGDDSGTQPPSSPCTQCVITIGSSRDNTLYDEPTGSTSNGSGDNMFMGLNTQGLVRRALVHFDIYAFIPASATIDSARLELTVTSSSGGPQQAALFRVTTDWGEGASNPLGPEDDGTAATPGDATWLNPFFPDSLWTNPGGDFKLSLSAVARVDGAFTQVFWPATDSTTADIQLWLDDPSVNFGWLVAGNELTPGAVKSFATRENIIPSRRPKLQVFYRR